MHHLICHLFAVQFRRCAGLLALFFAAVPAALALPQLSITAGAAGSENPYNEPFGKVDFVVSAGDDPIPAGTRVSFQVEGLAIVPGGRIAEYGQDYLFEGATGAFVESPGRLRFTGPGAAVITFKVLRDVYVEGMERFRVRLFAPQGATLGNAVASGTIQDANRASWIRLLNTSQGLRALVQLGYDTEGYIELSGLGSLGVNPSVALADVDRDGALEMILGSGAGVPSRVIVLPLRLTNPVLADRLFEFSPYAAFAGGVYVAAGDVNGDGVPEIVTGPGAGGAAHLQVWRVAGLEGVGSPGLLYSFFMDDGSFTGGIRVACGDVNGDGRAEFVACYGPGAQSFFQIYDGATGQPLPRGARSPYGAFAGGASVTMCDLDHDGFADIATGPDAPGASHVRVFSPHKDAWIDDFLMDGDTTGVMVAGLPGVTDPRGLLFYTERGLYAAHPMNTAPHLINASFHYYSAPGAVPIPAYPISNSPAIAAGVMLEPVRPALPPPVMPVVRLVSTTPAAPPTQPFPVQGWSFTPVDGQFYELEVSTGLTYWTMDSAHLAGGTISLVQDAPRKYFRLRVSRFSN